MPASKTPKPRAPRPRLSISEKRRVVELALQGGASLRAIARQHGISNNTLHRWVGLHRAGKLEVERVYSATGASKTTFLPVTLGSAVRSLQSPRALPTSPGEVDVVELTIASGGVLRIETSALSIDLIRALVAELRR
jgi:transposase-like protein